MLLREPITTILVAAALIGWGVNFLANKLMPPEPQTFQVCEQVNPTTTVCRTVLGSEFEAIIWIENDEN